MIEVICLLTPAFITLKVENILLKSRLKKEEMIEKYGLYTSILLTLSLIILKLTVEDPNQLFNSKIFTINFTFKYLIMIDVLAVLLGLIAAIIKKNIDITLEVKNEENTK